MRLRGTHFLHTFKYPRALIIAFVFPLLTESCRVKCLVVLYFLMNTNINMFQNVWTNFAGCWTSRAWQIIEISLFTSRGFELTQWPGAPVNSITSIYSTQMSVNVFFLCNQEFNYSLLFVMCVINMHHFKSSLQLCTVLEWFEISYTDTGNIKSEACKIAFFYIYYWLKKQNVENYFQSDPCIKLNLIIYWRLL